MRELARMGHQSIIITSTSNRLANVPAVTESYLLQRVDGVQVWWVKTLNYQAAKSIWRILSWFHFEWRLLRMPKAKLPRPDAIVVSSLSLLTVLNGFFMRWRYGARLVFEIRDIWPLTITEEGGFSTYNPLVLGLAYIERLGYLYSDALVGTMPNLGEHVSQVLGEPKPTYCIPMGVDEDSLKTVDDLPSDFVSKYIPLGKFVIAHVGSIGITNALDTMLECARAMDDESSIHFLVVGDGDLRVYYQQKYASLKNLTFVPPVPKSMVPAILSHCDLLYLSTHPSRVWKFGQSLNKLVDYMLAGKPIVASYTGFQSMINEANCGSFVPAGNVELLCLEFKRYARMPPSVRDEVGGRGRKWLLDNRLYPKLAGDYLKILLTPNDEIEITTRVSDEVIS
jgi:glycosyltransferase involved in cell wall biosynthesis